MLFPAIVARDLGTHAVSWNSNILDVSVLPSTPLGGRRFTAWCPWSWLKESVLKAASPLQFSMGWMPRSLVKGRPRFPNRQATLVEAGGGTIAPLQAQNGWVITWICPGGPGTTDLIDISFCLGAPDQTWSRLAGVTPHWAMLQGLSPHLAPGVGSLCSLHRLLDLSSRIHCWLWLQNQGYGGKLNFGDAEHHCSSCLASVSWTTLRTLVQWPSC